VEEKVSLVIPGRNAAQTVAACLDSVTPLLGDGPLGEIIFVDDGSTDDTARIVSGYSVRLVPGPGAGPGAARNLGWRSATGELIWFIDSDCVAEPDALDLLLPHLRDPKVGGVSGSYGNMRPDSLLACLIHEEIIERHRRMPQRVNFLATFNVLYRRSVLEKIGGFNEQFLRGQDAELSWRVLAAGYELAFEIQSRVRHFHATRWGNYLRAQRLQGYWRVFLHLTHKGHAAGDSYSSLLDHIQPPLALTLLLLVLAACLPMTWPYGWWLAGGLLVLLAAGQIPMTARLVRATGRWRYLAFAPMAMARAFYRGVGMTTGILAVLGGKGRRE
jgi:glycosyltransferase involved in cell wall biosynthesis